MKIEAEDIETGMKFSFPDVESYNRFYDWLEGHGIKFEIVKEFMGDIEIHAVDGGAKFIDLVREKK